MLTEPMLVAIAIGVMILGTVAAAFVLGARLANGRILFDRRPDKPVPFGYRMSWLAVRTSDMRALIGALGMPLVQRANWNTGLGTVYHPSFGETHIYVTPPVNGWMFVVGLALPQPLGPGFADKTTPLLLRLAAIFPEVQYYSSCPALDFYAWARFKGGKLLRAFAINDEGVVWDAGKPTKEEQGLGLRMFEPRKGRRKKDAEAEMPSYPTEAHVLHLASCWSLDPTSLSGAKADLALGVICGVPATWRPERLRKAG